MIRRLAILLLALLGATAALAAGPLELSVQAPSPELADHVRAIAAEAAPKLEAWTGASPGKVLIQVMPTREWFEKRMNQLGGPRWAAGLALPERGLIVLRSPRQLGDPEQFRHLTIHELLHLYLAAGLKGRRAPLWLEEGLAMRLSGEGGWGRSATMAGGVLGAGLIPFGELAERFPDQAQQAALAYAQSYYLVTWLQNEYGPQALAKIIKGLSQGRPLTAALRQTTGLSLAALEERFSDDMHSRFSWIAVLGTGGVLWGLVALGAGVGLVARRRRQKMAVARMDDAGGVQTQMRPRPRSGRGRRIVLREAGMDTPRPRESSRSREET
ncbi:peptidase MA family metallohydrolase [Desulfoferula mesophila]|uniref:Peptidase MA-like domain-containing protein n=1 Tax=Desulfoferula mesophila TaxID=3058419 RepID=A0AAU9EGW0_9BACT|nr:hypothetical protein FAK_15400 [Desulfoferula mesophilus]